MVARNPHRGRAKPPAFARVCANTWEGTQPIVEKLVLESTYRPAWRPVRALATMAMAAQTVDHRTHVWMSTAEFQHWHATHFEWRRRGPKLKDELGIAKTRRLALRDGAAVTKIEALAFAHYAAGLPLPCELTPDDLADWFAPRFSASEGVAAVLHMKADTLLAKMRGYAMKAGVRVAREPDVTLLRALDWVWRVGPFSPYGARIPAPVFPGQPEDLT